MKNSILLLLLSLVISITGCNNTTDNSSSDTSKLSVSVSFHAMEEFVKVVGQDKVTISTIVPTGMEPHDFEPKVSDIAKLVKADVFVYNGLGMESWAEKTIQSAENESLIIVVASDNADLIENTDQEELEEHGVYDPHVWLSLKGAVTEVQNIADGLSQADPDNQTFYQNNAADYITQLEKLYEEYKKKFDSIETKSFVTGHAAFQYFCRDFGLSQNSIEDVFAKGEPSTKQLTELVDYCIEHNVTTIFSEESASPLVSQTLADEIGAEVIAIHTIENPEGEMTYFDRIKENCEKVYSSLQ